MKASSDFFASTYYNLLYGIVTELQTANTIYNKKLKDGNSTDQTMFNLSLDV